MKKNTLLVADLFAGTGSSTEPLAQRGHKVVRFELSEEFDAEHHLDILTLDAGDIADLCDGWPDVIFAGPPCQGFSNARLSDNWEAIGTCHVCGDDVERIDAKTWEHRTVKDCPRKSPRKPYTYRPIGASSLLSLRLAEHTLDLIRELSPEVAVIENPVALLRKMERFRDLPRETVTYDMMGDLRRQKPTDLFFPFGSPAGWKGRACKQHRAGVPGCAYHPPTGRGSRHGTQGLSTAEAGRWAPYLPIELADAIEHALLGKPWTQRTEAYGPHEPLVITPTDGPMPRIVQEFTR